MSAFYDNALNLYNNQNYEEAVKYFKRSFEEDDISKNIAACYYISMCSKYLGDNNNKLKYLFNSFKYYKPQAEICCELGTHFMDDADYKTAIFWFELASNLEKPKEISFCLPDYCGYIPNLLLCFCHDKLNNLELANMYNDRAYKFKPDSEAVIYNKKYFFNALKDTKPDFIEQQKLIIKQQRAKYKDYVKPGVSLILSTNKSDYMENIFKTYERLNYEPKELIIILNNNEMSFDRYNEIASKYNNIRVFQIDQSHTLGECLNYAIEKSNYDYIAKIDDDDFYGENYLIDQMNVFNYTDAYVTGKSKWFNYFEHNNDLRIMRWTPENAMTTAVAGGTILAKKEVFNKIKFHKVNFAEDKAFFEDCLNNGYKIYSNNRFNYAYIRHINLDNHTWKVDTSEIENISLKVNFENCFEDIVDA